MVKISIIIPVYNSSNYLNRTINSIVNQTLSDIEVICVDDGSSDDSLFVLENLKREHDFIKILSQDHQGAGKARNYGIYESEGEYIAFLDSDDVMLDKNVLKIMYDIAHENNANVVSANLCFIEEDNTFKENWHYVSGDYVCFNRYGYILPQDYGIPYGYTKSIYNRAFLFKNDIYFPEILTGEDPIFMAKVFLNTDKIYTVPLNYYGYYHSRGGGVNVKINNFKKKSDYMKHFLDTINLLQEGDFQECANEYKIHLLHYLTWRDNIFDEDLYELFDQMFASLNDFFDETFEKYINFNILFKLHSILKKNNNSYFLNVKNELSELNYHNDMISKKLDMILTSNSFDELKYNYCMDPIEHWKGINKLLHRDFLIIKINNLIYKNSKLIANNKELINNIKFNIDNYSEEVFQDNRVLVSQNKELINQNYKQLDNLFQELFGSL